MEPPPAGRLSGHVYMQVWSSVSRQRRALSGPVKGVLVGVCELAAQRHLAPAVQKAPALHACSCWRSAPARGGSCVQRGPSVHNQQTMAAGGQKTKEARPLHSPAVPSPDAHHSRWEEGHNPLSPPQPLGWMADWFTYVTISCHSLYNKKSFLPTQKQPSGQCARTRTHAHPHRPSAAGCVATAWDSVIKRRLGASEGRGLVRAGGE